MSHPAADWRHPNHQDYETGRNDGSEFNPYRHPYDRTGIALEAYNAGYDFGLECMDDYHHYRQQHIEE